MRSRKHGATVSGVVGRRAGLRLNGLGIGVLAPVLMVAPAPGLVAQEEQGGTKASSVIEEVIVTARRKQENLQDVPVTVNVVSAEELDGLNIRKLEDMQTVVAGLTLQEDSIAPNASVRGVRFDTFASGFNSTVEFYLNDSPIVSLSAMQALFDIGQIEVLRGPQGTLRGRASPSGAITMTTRRPDLEEFNGYVDLTASDLGSRNARVAVNVPILEKVLALRVAGLYEENEGNRVDSINSSESSETKSDGYRVSLRYEPIESLSVNLMHQKITPERVQFTQVESANIADPSQPASPRHITKEDRLAVSNIPRSTDQELKRTGLEVEWAVENLQLNYAGSRTEMLIERQDIGDVGDFFDATYPDALQDYGQQLQSKSNGQSHELRLSSSIDRFDYVVGALYQKNEPENDLIQMTPVFFGTASPATFVTIAETPVATGGKSEEKSLFGNVTWHLSEVTELSTGLRYIEFDNEQVINVNGRIISDVDDSWNETIYLLSLKHRFNDALMGYATAGSSWRPGVNAVGNFSTAQTARERSFQVLDPETSDSLELGTKANLLNNRLRLNSAVFYQRFDNYPYRAGGSGVHYVSTDNNGTESVEQFNFVAAVPVDVYGVEVEALYQPTAQWTVGGLFSWAKGELDNGTVPCNDYSPADGQPDSGGSAPTVSEIRTATGGENVAACEVDYRANFAPLWTSTLHSEYTFPVAGLEAYVRGLVTTYGDSKNDPSNSIDDVDSYSILNLFTGVRGAEGKWEVMLYGKNLAETERRLSREATPADASFVAITGFGPGGPITDGRNGVSTYREISMTPEREFGINLRYNF